MAGQVLLLNPRRRRRKSSSRKRRKTHARVANPVKRRRRRRSASVARVVHRRRRRNPSRRRHHSRRRRNPSMHGMFGGGNIGKGIALAGGMVAAEFLADKLANVLPAAWKTNADLVRIGSKAAIGIGLPLVLKRVRMVPPGIANAIALGGVAVTVLDIFKTYIGPKIGLNLSEYQAGVLTGMEQGELSEYQEGALSDFAPTPGGGAYGGGAYGDMLTGF